MIEMIVRKINGNIFETDCKNILVAADAQSLNNAGFIAEVIRRLNWTNSSLQDKRWKKLGTSFKKEKDGKTYHFLVCHGFFKEDGWKETARIIKEYLDNLNDIVDVEEIASVIIGSGAIGLKSGANPKEILVAMKSTKCPVVIYYL